MTIESNITSIAASVKNSENLLKTIAESLKILAEANAPVVAPPVAAPPVVVPLFAAPPVVAPPVAAPPVAAPPVAAPPVAAPPVVAPPVSQQPSIWPSPKAAPTPPVVAPPVSQPSIWTAESINQLCGEVANKLKSPDQVKNLLAQYNVKGVATLPPEQFNSFVAALNALV